MVRFCTIFFTKDLSSYFVTTTQLCYISSSLYMISECYSFCNFLLTAELFLVCQLAVGFEGDFDTCCLISFGVGFSFLSLI